MQTRAAGLTKNDGMTTTPSPEPSSLQSGTPHNRSDKAHGNAPLQAASKPSSITVATPNSKWNMPEKALLAEELCFAAAVQTAYGQAPDIKILVESYARFLADNYTAEQVILAVRKFVPNHNRMPTPSDLVAIINPPAPKVTYAEYSHAIKLRDRDRLTFEREGWSQVINDYHNQKDPLND